MRARAMTRPRLLSIGRIRAASGFGRQMAILFDRLSEAWDIHHIGTDLAVGGAELRPESWTLHWAEPGDMRGLAALAALQPRLEPDLVLVTDDLWNISPPLEVVERLSAAPVVASSPVDGIVTDGRVLDFLPRVARFVTYTRHSRATCLEAVGRMQGTAAQDRAAARIDVIPPGVETTRFRPLVDPCALDGPQRHRAARRRLLPDAPHLWDGFLVLNANTNTHRKRPDLTLEAFALFCRGLPADVRLLMHMNWLGWGCDIEALAERLGILDRLLWIGDRTEFPDLDLETLNLVYNAADCGLSTTMAEGWGFVPLEHAATQAPQILPDFGGLSEIWGGAAALVETAADVAKPWLPLGFREVRAEGVAHRLRGLYDSPEERARVAARCRDVALDPALSPAAVAGAWSTLLDSVMSETVAP